MTLKKTFLDLNLHQCQKLLAIEQNCKIFVKHKISFKKNQERPYCIHSEARREIFQFRLTYRFVCCNKTKQNFNLVIYRKNIIPLLNCRYFLPPIDIMLFCFVHKKQMKNDEIASIYSI
jgi:hypothetical protein